MDGTKVSINDVGDAVCEHGTALDCDCPGCHTGFFPYDPDDDPDPGESAEPAELEEAA